MWCKWWWALSETTGRMRLLSLIYSGKPGFVVLILMLVLMLMLLSVPIVSPKPHPVAWFMGFSVYCVRMARMALKSSPMFWKHCYWDLRRVAAASRWGYSSKVIVVCTHVQFLLQADEISCSKKWKKISHHISSSFNKLGVWGIFLYLKLFAVLRASGEFLWRTLLGHSV